MKKAALLVLCLFVLLPGLIAGADAREYRAREYSLPAGQAGMVYSWANAINDSGRIAGVAYDSAGSHAVISDSEGELAIIGDGSVLGINDYGVAVGYAGKAAVWDAEGNMTFLAPLSPNSTYSQACAINNLGQIVGECWIGESDVSNHITLWNPDSNPSDLGEGCGNSINDLGQIAGLTIDPNGKRRAFVWSQDKEMTILAGGDSSEALYINARGQVVGTVTDASGTRACVWGPDGNLTILSQVSGAYSSTAYAINNSGLIAGSCTTASGAIAVIWNADGSILRLDPLPGHTSAIAYGINSLGQVAGYSVDTSGMTHAVVWDPIPEPASILALLTGFGGLILRRKK